MINVDEMIDETSAELLTALKSLQLRVESTEKKVAARRQLNSLGELQNLATSVEALVGAYTTLLRVKGLTK